MAEALEILSGRVQAKRSELRAAEKRVEEKRGELQAEEQRASVIRAELNAWEQALQLVSGQGIQQDHMAHSPRSNGERRRGPRGLWRKVLTAVAERYPPPREFGFRDIENVGAAVGVPINRNTIRSQMANYVNAGMADRVQEGKFRLTDACMALTAELSVMSGEDTPAMKKPADGGAHTTGLFTEDEAV